MNALSKLPVIQVLRRMSVHEASFPLYAELSPGGGNVVSMLELAGELHVAAVPAALQQLQQRHALLRAAYRNLASGTEAADYCFVEVANSAIGCVQQSVDSLQALQIQGDAIRHSLLNHHYLHGDLLSRMVVLSYTASLPHRHCLYFCVSHVIADGSAMVQLLDECQQILNGGKLPAVPKVPAPLWSSMPAAIAGFAGAWRSLGTLLQFVRLQKQADRGLSFDFDIPAPASERRCIAATRRLDGATFSRLRAQVKVQHGSLHGTLAAALVAAFSDYLQVRRDPRALQDSRQALSIALVTTVDMRGKTQPPLAHDSIACLSSGVTSNARLPLAALQRGAVFPYADIARQLSAGISAALAAEQHWKVLRIYQLAGLKGLRKMFAQASTKPLSTPLSLANLGQLRFTAGTQLKVRQVEIFAAFHAMGPSMNIAINSLDDQLTLCISAPYPVCSQNTLNRFADACVTHLQAIAAG